MPMPILGLGIGSLGKRSTRVEPYMKLALYYGDVAGVVSGVVSLLMNVIATMLIGWKAWSAFLKPFILFPPRD